MKKIYLLILQFTFLGLLTLIPQVLASEMLDDLSVPQGKTVQLIIPQFDFTEASGSYEGITFPFYPVTETPTPETNISRAEFLQLLWLNYPAAAGCSGRSVPATDFPDVTTDNSFHDAIRWAANCSIINGYEDGLFHPYAPVTRGQAAKIIMKAYRPPQILDTTPAFLDLPIEYSLRNDIYQAVGAGVFRGYPDGLIRPDRAISFQEAEIITERASGLKQLTKIETRPVFRAFLGINRSAVPGSTDLLVKLKNTNGSEQEEKIALTVTRQNFAVQRFNLNEEKNKLFGKDYQDDTWKLIDTAKADTANKQFWEDDFLVPASGSITLGFGDKLYINGTYSGSHFGIDYANQEGTPVYASNTGLVTLAAETPAYGNTIVIDHGQSVFTMYLHLQELKVREGQIINKNDLIATMGSTGLSTASHLHFTIFIGNTIVDPQDWFEGY